MFCAKCGEEIVDGTQFCPNCGNKTGNTIEKKVIQAPKVMLDPTEVVEHKETADSSKTFSGQGRTIGLIMMIFSIVLDLVGMVAIGFDAFIPITIGSAALFVIGFLIRMFCP